MLQIIHLTVKLHYRFPGRGTTAYGQAVNENFLHLLENFANTTAPLRPVEGQLWYDSTQGVDQLKVYDGTNWVASGGLKKAAPHQQLQILVQATCGLTQKVSSYICLQVVHGF